MDRHQKPQAGRRPPTQSGLGDSVEQSASGGSHGSHDPQNPRGPGRPGRNRDEAIDTRILAAARRQLSVLGYEGMTIAAVAQEAGTTRQALYRRWPGKAELAQDAIADLDETPPCSATAGPFAALVGELTEFQRGISRPGRLSLVGTMLQETTEAEVLDRYRSKIIKPRRQRLTTILEAARDARLIDADADLEVAVAACTGNWYGRALAGDPVPADWPFRTAALVWRAVGGRVP